MTVEATGLTDWVDSPRTDAGIHWLDDREAWSYASYHDLAMAVRRTATWLGSHGVGKGDVVTIAVSRVDAFVAGFFGALYAGATPSPLAPPLASGASGGYVDHAAHMVRLARPRLMLADESLHPHLGKVAWHAADGHRPVEIAAPHEADVHEPAEGQAAPSPTGLLQFTSGSSGRPRGIEVGRDQLVTNIGMIRRWLGLGRDETTASWLPTHHDMGLVGCLLTPVLNQSPLRQLRPDQFIRDPARWLACFGRYGAATTATPTFGLSYTVTRFRAAAMEGLDLSGWRVAIVGAERIDAGVLARFAKTFAPYGFEASAFRPSYGLAEATLAVTGTRGGTPKVVRPDWSTLSAGEPVALTGPVPLDERVVGDGTGWAVCCGQAHAGLRLDVLDDEGSSLGDRRLGELAISGPSVITREPLGGSPTSTYLDGGQLRTGDAGFLIDGELVVLGRIGDSLKVRGRSVYAEELEGLIAAETGLPGGRAAVLLGVRGGRESVGLVTETALSPEKEARARATLARETGEAEVWLYQGPRGTILRTSSGKIRRREMWRQLARPGTARADAASAGAVTHERGE